MEVPVHERLRIEDLEEARELREVELSAKQYLSDSYSKTVKLVGVRTAREATVKPSARDVRFQNVRLTRVPVWTVTFGVDGTKEHWRRTVSAADGTGFKTEYPVCSGTPHEISRGTLASASCGHAVCPKHLHGCLTCMREYCGTCQPVLSCSHIACTEHTVACSLGTEQVCMKCAGNTCGHYTCMVHRRECEHCGKTVCEECTVGKGLLRKRIACSAECARFLQPKCRMRS